MQAYEKLGVFYLGRQHDLVARQTLPQTVLYNSSDLLTHALCVGMTGSGKTGLCFDLIEEAAIDGIPAILIDPKGDLGNLLLTFPELRPEDFAPWVSPDEARKKGLAPAEFAVQQAELWKQGLAAWDQDGARIRRLLDAAEFSIYTPGSNAGIPVSILNSFAAPPASIMEDTEILRERVNTTVSGLLGLVGVQAESTRSREAIFLANLIQTAWQDGRNLDLGSLIQEIQTPSLKRIGVMDVESFYPAKDRFELATAINGLLASPGFDAWLEGEPLDIQRMYYTPSGKPRVSIFSIAHLNDSERMFFVTLLLNQLLGWMRAQSGTTSLRAILYMDEIAGYFPPVANPPSKLPLLTLLKQGRAFGLGAVLATQNPVDLDYKGLANIGTWFLGRLQTDRDKQRVLDGLEGAAATQGSRFDRGGMEQTLAGLGNRIFLLHNVHEEGTAIFESRWAMSYLRGPMTRDQIRAVMKPRRDPAFAMAGVNPAPPAQPAAANMRTPASPTARPVPDPATTKARAETPRAEPLASTRPALPPSIPQQFIPARTASEPVVYVPMLLGAASVRFANAKAKVDVMRTVVLLTPIDDDAVPVDWAQGRELELDPNDLQREPWSPAEFAPLPPSATQPSNFTKWQRELVNTIYGTQKVTLLKSTTYNQVSGIDETEGDFRARLSQVAREERDAVKARLRAKYEPKVAALNERLRRAGQALEREAAQAKQAKLSSVIAIGSTLLGAFFGRRTLSSGNLSKAGTAVRSVGRASEQSSDVTRAGETIEALKQQLADLDAQFQQEVNSLEASISAGTESFETIQLCPAKTNIAVKLVTLAWAPHKRDASGELVPAFL